MAKIPPLLVLALVLVSMPVVVSIVRVNQDIRNQAAGCSVGRLGTCGTCCDGSTCYRDRDANCNVIKSCATKADPEGCGGSGGGQTTSKSPKEPTSIKPPVAKASSGAGATAAPTLSNTSTELEKLKQGSQSCGSSPAGTTSIGPGGRIYGCDGSTGRWEDMTGKGVGPDDLTDKPSWLTEDSDRWIELEKTSGKTYQGGGGQLPQNNMPTGNYVKPNACSGNYAPGSVAIGPSSEVYECGYDGKWRECSYCALNVVPEYVKDSPEMIDKYIVQPLIKQEIIKEYINLPSYKLAEKYCGSDQECLKNFSEEQYLSQIEGLTSSDITTFEQLREVAQTRPTPVPTQEPIPTKRPTPTAVIVTPTTKPTTTTGPTTTPTKKSTGTMTPTKKTSGTATPTKKSTAAPTATVAPTTKLTAMPTKKSTGALPTITPGVPCSGDSPSCDYGKKYTCVNGKLLENSNPGECYVSSYSNPPVPTNGRGCAGGTSNGANVCAGSEDCRVCVDGRLQKVSTELCTGMSCYRREPTPMQMDEVGWIWFYQADSRWGPNTLPGYSNPDITVGGNACGPTSVSMLICSLTNTCLDPGSLVEQVYPGNINHEGTVFGYNLEVLKSFGLGVATSLPTDAQSLSKYSGTNQPIFFDGTFNPGQPNAYDHYSIITDIIKEPDGTYSYVLQDPGSPTGHDRIVPAEDIDIKQAALIIPPK